MQEHIIVKLFQSLFKYMIVKIKNHIYKYNNHFDDPFALLLEEIVVEDL